jgi:hypothetical protein
MSVENVIETGKPTKEAEKKIAQRLKLKLESHFEGYVVETEKSLLYKIEIDPGGKVSHKDQKKVRRGQYAFQTDLLISTKSIPLVAIELKSGSFSSHDVITYSSKASRHKQIYPYLRYGFVVFGAEMLGRRFVTHNEAFDFAIAVPGYHSIDTELMPVVERQIESSERLIEMLRSTRVEARCYEEIVQIRQVME